MKASELVKELQTVIRIDGDLEVMLIKNTESSDVDDIPLRGISTCQGDDDRATHFLLCDEDTFDAFVEG